MNSSNENLGPKEDAGLNQSLITAWCSGASWCSLLALAGAMIPGDTWQAFEMTRLPADLGPTAVSTTRSTETFETDI